MFWKCFKYFLWIKNFTFLSDSIEGYCALALIVKLVCGDKTTIYFSNFAFFYYSSKVSWRKKKVNIIRHWRKKNLKRNKWVYGTTRCYTYKNRRLNNKFQYGYFNLLQSYLNSSRTFTAQFQSFSVVYLTNRDKRHFN